MPDELPNVGDLARVVRVCGCCDESRALLDRFVTVVALIQPETLLCGRCGKDHGVGLIAVTEPGSIAFRHDSLRRIPPLAELESVDTITEIESERPRERVTA